MQDTARITLLLATGSRIQPESRYKSAWIQPESGGKLGRDSGFGPNLGHFGAMYRVGVVNNPPRLCRSTAPKLDGFLARGLLCSAANRVRFSIWKIWESRLVHSAAGRSFAGIFWRRF